MSQPGKPEASFNPEDSLGAAFYPGKEDWKNEPGNRYTAEEIRAMHDNWDIQITPPHAPRSCPAD